MNPARFPEGIATAAAKNSILWSMPAPDPTKLASEFIDFSGADYLTTAWTVTETQAGATQNLTASDAGGEFGILRLANSAGATDLNSIQLTTAPIYISDVSKRWWLKTRISRDNADTGMGVGVQAVNATPFTVADGLWVNILGASTDAVFRITKGSASTTATKAAAYGTSALNTFVVLGMYYNGKDAVNVYVDDVQVGSITTLTNLPINAALTPTISQLNTSANARNVDCDYFFFAVER